MKNHALFAGLMAALMTTGCTQEQPASVTINLSSDYPEREIWLQDVGEVEYVPLETTDEMIYKGDIVHLDAGGITATDRRGGQVFLFDRKGKALHTFMRKGEGPDEFVEMRKVITDWKRKEVYVLDLKNRIQVYATDGTHKRTLKTGYPVRNGDMHNFSDSHLIMFREVPEGENAEVMTPYRPILLMSKDKGEADSLSLVKTNNVFVTASFMGMKGTRNPEALREYDGDIYLNDVGCDTLFHFDRDDQSFFPLLMRTPSVGEEGNKYLLTLKGVTPRYLFLKRELKEVDMASTKAEGVCLLAYDLQTKETFRPVFKNRDYPSQSINMNRLDFSEGVHALSFQLDAFKLKEALDEDGLNNSLKNIAEKIHEEDNPVLMLVRFSSRKP